MDMAIFCAEMIGVLIGGAIGAGVSYFVANYYVKENPGIKMEPALYALGGFFFGFMLPIAVATVKMFLYRDKQKNS